MSSLPTRSPGLSLHAVPCQADACVGGQREERQHPCSLATAGPVGKRIPLLSSQPCSLVLEASAHEHRSAADVLQIDASVVHTTFCHSIHLFCIPTGAPLPQSQDLLRPSRLPAWCWGRRQLKKPSLSCPTPAGLGPQPPHSLPQFQPLVTVTSSLKLCILGQMPPSSHHLLGQGALPCLSPTFSPVRLGC